MAASGAAYVYVRSPDGVWAGDFLTPVTGDAQGPYGTAVAVRDGVVAVGAPFSQDAAGPGQVTVFARSGGAWTEVATAASPTPDPAERFGSAVALGADRLLVHAEGADTFDGQTYVFGALPVDVADTPQESGLALGISPNPSAGDATVTLALDAPGAARVVVFDALGRRVAVLHDGPLAVGEHAFEIDAGRLAPGLAADGKAPRLHVHGDIHEAAGIRRPRLGLPGRITVNAAVLDAHYNPTHAPRTVAL